MSVLSKPIKIEWLAAHNRGAALKSDTEENIQMHLNVPIQYSIHIYNVALHAQIAGSTTVHAMVAGERQMLLNPKNYKY